MFLSISKFDLPYEFGFTYMFYKTNMHRSNAQFHNIELVKKLVFLTNRDVC